MTDAKRLMLLLGLLAGIALPAAPAANAAQDGPIVILGAHPDDETLGCGGLIARRAHEGRRIVVVVLTDGRALLGRFGIDRDPSPEEVSRMRKDETRRAVNILTDGRAEVRFLDFENERLIAQQAEATRQITAMLAELKPAELYVPSPFEGHAEHVAAHQIASDACAASGACGEMFEFIVSLKRGVSVDALPRRRIDVDVSAHRAREREALAQFRSHLDRISPKLPGPLTPDYDRYLTDEEPFLVAR